MQEVPTLFKRKSLLEKLFEKEDEIGIKFLILNLLEKNISLDSAVVYSTITKGKIITDSDFKKIAYNFEQAVERINPLLSLINRPYKFTVLLGYCKKSTFCLSNKHITLLLQNNKVEDLNIDLAKYSRMHKNTYDRCFFTYRIHMNLPVKNLVAFICMFCKINHQDGSFDDTHYRQNIIGYTVSVYGEVAVDNVIKLTRVHQGKVLTLTRVPMTLTEKELSM